MKGNKEKLNIAMARACIRNVDLIKAAKVSSYTIARWDLINLTPRTVGKVAKVLGVDVTELLEVGK